MENDLNINNVNLPYLEPLMPGEDASSPQTQNHLKSYSEAVKETMDILAEADAVKALKEQKKADMKRQARTLLLIFIEIVLKCNGCTGLGFPVNLYMLFRLDRLMEAVRIPAPGHDPSGEAVYDQDLPVFYNVILVGVHQVIGAKCQIDPMLDLQVPGI